VRIDRERPPLARDEQLAAARPRHSDAERGGVRIACCAGRGRSRAIEDDHQRPELAAGDQALLDHLAGARHRRPVDPRCGLLPSR
jgi:hypothetical protein